MAHLNQVVLGLCTYFYPVNTLSNKKRKTHLIISNIRELKLRRYTNHMVNLNECLSVFSRDHSSDKIGETEFNKIILNGMKNKWIKKSYAQGFDGEKLLLINL